MNKILMILIIGLAVKVQAGGDIISAEQLPAAVMTAAKGACPEGTVHQLELDKNGVYEVEMLVGDRTCDMKFRADGSVVEIEREVVLTELPLKVQTTLGLYTDLKIIKAEHVQKGDHIFYEAEVEFNGQVFGFEMEEDGTIFKMQLEG